MGGQCASQGLLPRRDITSWHNDGNNFLYLDGHVKWNKWDQLKWSNILNLPQGDPDFYKPTTQPPLQGAGYGR